MSRVRTPCPAPSFSPVFIGFSRVFTVFFRSPFCIAELQILAHFCTELRSGGDTFGDTHIFGSVFTQCFRALLSRTCQLPKLDVAGSNPVSRSIHFYFSVLCRGTRVILRIFAAPRESEIVVGRHSTGSHHFLVKYSGQFPHMSWIDPGDPCFE